MHRVLTWVKSSGNGYRSATVIGSKCHVFCGFDCFPPLIFFTPTVGCQKVNSSLLFLPLHSLSSFCSHSHSAMLLAKLVPVSKRITSVGRTNDSMQEGRYTLSLVYLGLRCV